jgi:hypothetical protein
MKTKIYLPICIASLFLISFLLNSCNDKKSEIRSQATKAPANAPPPTQPILTGLIEANVDQWKRLSIGYTVLLNNPNTCNNYDLRIKINNDVASNQGSPVRNYTLYNSLISSNFNFNVPSASTHDLYDAVAHSINNYTPPTSIPNWTADFFSSFIHTMGGTPEQYYVTIGIPARTFQAKNSHWNLPVLVCPDPEVFGYPMKAYGYNSAGSIYEVNIIDDEFYEDLIESGNYFVFAMAYDYEYLDESEIGGSCEGGFVVNDNICDGHCGENSINSPVDCGDHNKNKVLYLRELKINEDIADKGSTTTPDRKHWEKSIQGNYEPGFSCWIMNSNGHYSSRKKVLLSKTPIENVKRTRIKKSGTAISRGNSVSIPVADRNSSNYGAVVASEHFNPMLSTSFIFFFENDGLKRQKNYSNVPLSFGTTVFDSIFWKGTRGNFTAGKYDSEAWGFSVSGTIAPISPLLFYNKIPANSPNWVSENYNGEPIMAYYHGDVANKVDYVLYYYVNHR